MSELVFDDPGQLVTSSFNPEVQYQNFKKEYISGMTYEHARVFFLSGKKAKEALTKRSEETVLSNFSGWRIPIANTHYPGNRNMALPDDALTLHRVSGFLARYLLEKVLSAPEAEKLIIKTKIINPIAASNGITWEDGPEIYLSFFPGAEMFLESFKFYPLAIGIYKVQKKMMDPKFLEKTMRQKYAGMDATTWTQTKTNEVINAVVVVSNLGWKKTNVSTAAREFLLKFGIQL
ncbi:nucleocapsid protein [Macaua virus]|uniref:Nucleoprotein n=1 Tax=Macaua virus TaxID=273352 RepID=H6U329_9VIRU|nr:nucleocapsid protein [Macaua virus]AEZ35263.1 nucleocapsid protein [Macaua virus]